MDNEEKKEPKKQRLQVDLLAKLKEYQGRNHLSVKSLSKKLGVSPQTLAQWYEKHRKLRPRECVMVERLLEGQDPQKASVKRSWYLKKKHSQKGKR